MALTNVVDFYSTPASAKTGMRSRYVTQSNGVVVRKSSIRKLPIVRGSMGRTRASFDVLVQKSFVAAFLNSCILTAYIRGLTIELKKYSAKNELVMR